MIFLYFFLVALLVVLFGYLLFGANLPVYTLVFGEWVVHIQAAVFFLGAAFLLFASYLLICLLRWPFGLAGRYQEWRRINSLERSESFLQKGLISFLSGDWADAERAFLKTIDYTKTPVAGYLAAAHAADRQDRMKQREHYLQLAYTHGGEGNLSTVLSWVRLRLDQRRYSESLKMLQELRRTHPNNAAVKSLLVECNRRMENWQEASQLLPKNSWFSWGKFDANLDREAVEIYIHLLSLAAEKKDLKAISQLWLGIPKRLQNKIKLLGHYIRLRLAINRHDIDSGRLLKKHLKKNLHEELVRLYGIYEGKEAKVQLSFLMNLLKSSPSNATLLLTIGVVADRLGLFGQAKYYYEESIRIRPTPDAYRHLGHMLEKDNEADKAKACFEQCVALMDVT